jgi:hypothetical protein
MLDPGIIGSPLRATIVVTLLLTMVALKFTVGGSLPSIPYNTLIDIYFKISFGGLAVITFLTAIPQFFEHENSIHFELFHHTNYDMHFVNLVLAIASFIFVVMGLVWWFYFANTRKWKRVKLTGISREICTIIGGKNYYCFRYCTPPYLDNSRILLNIHKTMLETNLIPSADTGDSTKEVV